MSHVQYLGGDGLTFERAVVISGASSMLDGVAAEYAWLKKHYPDAVRTDQRLFSGLQTYDRFILRKPDGKRFAVFFDISQFHGRGPSLPAR